MITGQTFDFGYFNETSADRMHAIKQAGFDEVMLWCDDDIKKVERRFYEELNLAQKNNLNVNAVHFPQTYVQDIWRDGDSGEAFVYSLKNAIRICGEQGVENIVIHTTRRLNTPPPNMIGVNNIRRALDEAEKYNLNIAVENTRFLTYNLYLYDRIDSKRLTFCFDSGHANCFTPHEDPLALFGDKLSLMHLHDNNGFSAGDEHLLPGEGNIDFVNVLKRLKALGAKRYYLETQCSRDIASTLPMQEYLINAAQALNNNLKIAGII
ncbi:MAG: sugar phosphate isomerase/epimerase family protein [Eubacteriales bacterium]|nr:sugar phosphate isomerase/epimerase family protein [Eubacteriales bacterium]